MHLNSIKLAGFKSFVDSTHLAFQSNLTAIVGPNGCGKSNIVDAIYFVLGSNSRNLRAEQMSDVIFNGTSSRQPIAQASIELVFDNSDARIGGEYGKYSEISIRREINREGLSNYFLNGVRCRRRDITDIFLGTGLGNNSYAIIEQGVISRLIEAKPEELRLHVEEAAGTSKYKERRRETEIRIKHTRENLDRLNDLREEQAKQLNHLQRQANAAEKYKVLKTEQRLIKAQLQVILWQGFHEDEIITHQKIHSEELLFESKMAEIRELDKEIEQKRCSRSEKNDTLNEVQSKYYTLGTEMTRIEQQISNTKERKNQLENDFRLLQDTYKEQDQQLFEDQNQLEELTQEVSTLEHDLTYLKEQAEQQQAHLLTSETEMSTWQEQWENFNRLCANASKQFEVEKTKIHHFEQKHQALMSRLTRIQEEKLSDQTEAITHEVATLEKQQQECHTQLEISQDRLEVTQKAIQSYRTEQNAIQQEVTLMVKELRGMQAQYATLQAMQQIALGKNGDEINTWLTQHQLENQKRLAESLEVADGWELAVEIVLANHLDAVCITDYAVYISAVQDLDNIDISFFNLKECDMAASRHDIPSLSEKVSSNWPVATLLQSIYVAENLSSGLQTLPFLASHESIVTRDGIWFSQHWLRVKKTRTDKTGILQREHDIKDIQKKIIEQQALLAKKESACHDLQEQLGLAVENRDQVLHELQLIKAKNSDLFAQIKAKNALILQLEQKNQRLDKELSENKEQLHEVENHLETARATLISASRSNQEAENQRQQLLDQREHLRNTLVHARREANISRQKLDESLMRYENIRNQVHYLKQSISRMERQLETTTERKQQLEAALTTINDPLPELSMKLQEMLEKRALIEDQLVIARQARDELESNLALMEKTRQQVEQSIQETRSSLEQTRIASQTIRVKMENHVEQINQAGFILEELRNQLPEDANVATWEDKIIKIEKRIQKLGPINLAAIDEYHILLERKGYLDKQHDDLIEALTTLENAIRKMDKETRTRFKETFTKLNDSFKVYFKEIFNGGDAYLELTSEDLLETGVIVKAQPPGKRNSTIHLLSGGEKALTAIALVFAIFSLNPAPFCILDEVDAPLDDANVVRFCHLVKKMAESIQFIFISHNKLTIEMAEQLAGITMNEPGVSRLVSVDIEQAIRMATTE
jgi:chromosome segregation protein